MSSPTRRAAAAPASVAAFTDPTSPRTIAVTSPASTFCQPTKTTFAALTMASAASIMPTKPRVSIRPSASPISGVSFPSATSGPFFAIRHCQFAIRNEKFETSLFNFAFLISHFASLLNLSPCGDRQALHALAIDEPQLIHEIGNYARVIREYAHLVTWLERGRPRRHPNRRMFLREPFDDQ